MKRVQYAFRSASRSVPFSFLGAAGKCEEEEDDGRVRG